PPRSARRRRLLGIDLRFEPNQQLAAEIEHRPLDHRWLPQHQRESFTLVETFLVAVRQFAERGTCTIEQGLPAEFVAPLFQPVLGDALGLVIMKIIGHSVAIEPDAGLLHGVAVLDAINGDGQFRFLSAILSFVPILYLTAIAQGEPSAVLLTAALES